MLLFLITQTHPRLEFNNANTTTLVSSTLDVTCFTGYLHELDYSVYLVMEIEYWVNSNCAVNTHSYVNDLK